MFLLLLTQQSYPSELAIISYFCVQVLCSGRTNYVKSIIHYSITRLFRWDQSSNLIKLHLVKNSTKDTPKVLVRLS